MPAHLPQHPHFCGMHILNMGVLSWQALSPILLNIPLSFGDTFLSHKAPGTSLLHPRRNNTMCDIIIDVLTSLNYRPQVLETIFLGDSLSVKPHFHTCLLH